MDLVSVIIPVYMSEQYLNRCIESACRQTYENIEIVLIDDGSTDQSSEICDRWKEKDNRIKVIHQQNQGISVARNVGIEKSNGKYIVMLDSDDYLFPEMIKRMYSIQEKYDTDLVICGFEKGKSETFEGLQSLNPQIEIIDSQTALMRIYESDEKALQYVAPWAKLYKKKLFKDIRYPTGKIFEDIYVTHQILYRCNRIAVTSQKMLYYYQHPESIMNRKFHIKKLDYLEALKRRIDFFEENKLEKLKIIAGDEYIHSLIWEYSRTRDLIKNKDAMSEIVSRYRKIYKWGYSSKRYPQETKLFLWLFYLNPEFVMLYWKIEAKLKRVF